MPLIATSTLIAFVTAFGAEPAGLLAPERLHEYAAAIFLASTLVVVLIGGRAVLILALTRLSSRTSSFADNALLCAARCVHVWSLLVVSLGIGIMAASLPQVVSTGAAIVVIILSVYETARAVGGFIQEFGTASVRAKAKEDGVRMAAARSSVRFMAIGARGLVWIVGFLFLLSNLGIDITSLVAGLGVGGIIIGFALQAILQDLFSSFSIHFDKPFEEGDFIIVGNEMGTVEKIGIKSTRIRALQGEQITVPNTDLMSSRIMNYQRMDERRIVFGFRVLLETPTDKLSRIPGIVKSVIEKIPKTRFDRAHLKSFGDDSFVFETVYYVLSADYNLYMDINQDILLALRAALDAENISLAYPTRLIDLRRDQQSDSGTANR